MANDDILSLTRRLAAGEELPEREAYLIVRAFRGGPNEGLQSAVERLVDHPIELVRQSALDALVNGATAGEGHMVLARRLLKDDPDSGTRAYAALAAATLAEKLHSRTPLADLISVLRNPDESQEVRLAAYAAILSIAGRRVANMPRIGDATWDPEQDVDWDLIQVLSEGAG